MAYNISKMQEQFSIMNREKKASTKKGPPFAQWKPSLSEDGKTKTYNIRFLPYLSQNEQPFQDVNYYDNKSLSPFRLVAPAQFGLPDPIGDLLIELRKQWNNKESWNVVKSLQAKPRYYAPVFVREEAEKGVQVWEISPTVCKEIYAIILSEDYNGENVAHPEKGYDFQVTVSPSGKTFTPPGSSKSYPVNDIKVMARTKPSKLAKTQEEADRLIASIPNLLDIFTKQVKSGDELREMLETFLSAGAKNSSSEEDEGTNHTSGIDAVSDATSAKSVEDQFAGL